MGDKQRHTVSVTAEDSTLANVFETVSFGDLHLSQIRGCKKTTCILAVSSELNVSFKG